MTEHPHESATSICPELIELAAWRDRRMESESATRIELHLARCSDCRELVAVAGANDADVDDGGNEAQSIQRAIELVAIDGGVDRAAHHRNRWVLLAWRGAAVAAGVVLAVSGYRVGAAVRPLVQDQAMSSSTSVEPAFPFVSFEASTSIPTVLDLYLDPQTEERP